MMLNYLFGRPQKKDTTIKDYDLRTLLETRKRVAKSISGLQGIAASLEMASMAKITSKDPQGKKVDIVDPDEVSIVLLELHTAEHIIDTRLGMIYLETGNTLPLDKEVFDLKFMVITLVNLFSRVSSEKELAFEKLMTTDIGYVHSDGEKVHFILMTILRLILYYAKKGSKIHVTTFKHDQYFCFYAGAMIDRSLVKSREEPFSLQTIKQDHDAHLESTVVLAEKYTELIGGRLTIVRAENEKSNDNIKFVVDLSLYHS